MLVCTYAKIGKLRIFMSQAGIWRAMSGVVEKKTFWIFKTLIMNVCKGSCACVRELMMSACVWKPPGDSRQNPSSHDGGATTEIY